MGQVFTGKRVVHPQPDWWYVGGRMMPGESPARSCARLIKRELGLVIAPERFTPITYNSLVWDMREQEVLSICATARRLALEPRSRCVRPPLTPAIPRLLPSQPAENKWHV